MLQSRYDITNFNTMLLRANAIAPYYSMFPLDFPLKHLSMAHRGQWVLDPFCGRGTTNYAARLLGLPTIAIDSNPVAVAITRSKLVDVTPDMVIQLCKDILASKRKPKGIPTGQFWDLCYHKKTLYQICLIRETLLEESNEPAHAALLGIMLGILHGGLNKGVPSYLSNQMPRTYATKPVPAVRYWKKHGLEPPHVDVFEVVARRVRYIFARLPRPVEYAVYLGDSREIRECSITQKIDWVITSPPYPGMRTYYPDQWLRNWFVGGKPDVEYVCSSQIGRYSGAEYIKSLACVWREVANVCRPGAKLVVRFGALPSVGRSPLEVLTESLSEAACGWVITGVESAGTACNGKRQAEQFNSKAKHPIEEIDVVATLE